MDYEANLPGVALEIVSVTPDSGSNDGEIVVAPKSPDGSVTAFDADLNEAGTWAQTNQTGNITFSSLDDSNNPQVIQLRDYGGGTPGEEGDKVYIDV
jgi:hypothetical protein